MNNIEQVTAKKRVRLKRFLVRTNKLLVYYETSLISLGQIIRYKRYSIETKIEYLQAIFKVINVSFRHHKLSAYDLKDYLIEFSIKHDTYKDYIYLEKILMLFDKHDKNLISNFDLELNNDNYDSFIEKWEKHYAFTRHEISDSIKELDQLLIDYNKEDCVSNTSNEVKKEQNNE